jgi:dipeptidyl-peptidase-4
MRFLVCTIVISTFLGFGTGAADEANRLTIDRIFSDPSLSGPTVRQLKFSPDGSRVTFLKSRAEDFERYDLWEYNLKDRATRMLVDSEALVPGEEKLSDEEKARRERMRVFARGIVEYYWSDDGKALLFPLGGDLYYYDLTAPPDQATRRLTDTPEYETDPRFSPEGRFVSFIRDQDIVIIDLETDRERQLTFDGTGVIKNGMAEFIAQEEMDRETGYWWSEDDRYIAFTQVDESPVGITQRYEIYADTFKVFDQRYPYAGTPNVLIKLGVIDVATGTIKWLDLGEDTDIYLARVDWLPDSKHVAVQIEPRDQKSLDLLFADVGTGRMRPVLREESKTWINLNNDLTFLKKKPQFIWASERTGYKHLYLYDLGGTQIRPLTAGDWVVDSLSRLDEKRGVVYFDGFAKSPLERHLYSTSLKTKNPEAVTQITKGEGWYSIAIAKDASSFIAWFSNPDIPPRVSLHKMNGRLVTYLESNALDENHPYYPYLKEHVSPEFGSINAEDGTKLYYELMKPFPFDPAEKYPVIVYVYGGPAGQMVTKSWGGSRELWFEFMAQNGYVVFSLDNRGTPNRGKAFEGYIYRHQGEVEVRDQVAGVEFLKTLPYVDGDRIGIIGHSNGGYMTLMCMMKAPECFQAGVSIAPVTDWRLYDTCYTERYLGNPKEDPEAYEKSGVFPYVDGLKGALLLSHGMADDNVLFTNSTKLYKVLQDKDIPFEMMDYPGSKHGLRGKPVQTHMYKTLTRFLDDALRPSD